MAKHEDDSTKIVTITGDLSNLSGLYKKNQTQEQLVKRAREMCLRHIKTDLVKNGTLGVSRDSDGYLVQFFEEATNAERNSERDYWFTENLFYRLERINGVNARYVTQINNATPPINPKDVNFLHDIDTTDTYTSCGEYVLSVNRIGIPPGSESLDAHGKLPYINDDSTRWLHSWVPELFQQNGQIKYCKWDIKDSHDDDDWLSLEEKSYTGIFSVGDLGN